MSEREKRGNYAREKSGRAHARSRARFASNDEISSSEEADPAQITSPSNSNKRRRATPVIIHPLALSLLTLQSVYLIKYH